MGNRITPSWVAFSPDGQRLIGEAAKNQAILNPTNTLYDVKRIIGRSFSDPTVQRDMKMLPYKIINKNDKPYFQVQVGKETKTFAPEEISAMVLQAMKETAEAYLGKPVHSAVITVPAYFNDEQRRATQDAGRIAGLNVLRVINEPTAAAIAFGMKEAKAKERNVLVYDLGGGTFDVSLLTIDGDVFEVVATNGDTHLGGEDFDDRVVEFLLKEFQKKHNDAEIVHDKRALQKLRRKVEDAKKALTTQHSVDIVVEAFHNGEDYTWKLSRAKFEDLNMDLFKRTLDPVRKVLSDAKMKKTDIDQIVLVGGSTRIPKVQQLVRDFFDGREPTRAINPDEAIAIGAAYQGGILSDEPDESPRTPTVLDVLSLSLGIETVGGIMTNLIERQTMLPVTKTKMFSTSDDNQESVLIQVFEGERALTRDNHMLGKFDLTGIKPAPRGVPQIEVTFTVDVNSRLHVRARDLASKSAQEITIQRQGSRTEQEIEKMVADAAMRAEEDRKLRETIEARNALENYAFHSKAALEKSDTPNREEAKREIEECIQWIHSTQGQNADKSTVLQRHEALENIVRPHIKEQQQQQQNHEEQDINEM